MTEPGTTVRTLFFLLVTGLIALFVVIAVDTIVPAVQDPFAVWESPGNPAYEARITEIDSQLDAGTITQEQADVAYDEAAVKYETVADLNGPSDAEMAAYDANLSRRNLTVGIADLLASALLLGAGVVLRRRGAQLAGIALLAGPVVGFVGGMVVTGTNLEAGMVMRLTPLGVAAAMALGAGLLAFRVPKTAPSETGATFDI